MVSITWSSNQTASAVYAAARATRWLGFGSISPIFSSMAAASQSLERTLNESTSDIDQLWQTLLSIAKTCDSLSEFTEHLLTQPLFSDLDPQQLSTALGKCTRAFQDCCPRFDEEMQYRQLPLRNLWEAEGPGLLQAIAQQAGITLPPQVSIGLMQPISNGGGLASYDRSGILVEAVLNHQDPRLPETLRLGWLIAQCSLPVRSGRTDYGDVSQHALALVPFTLSVGEQAGATILNTDVILAALKHWAGGPHWRPQEITQPEMMAEVLHTWWTETASSKLDWHASVDDLSSRLERYGIP